MALVQSGVGVVRDSDVSEKIPREPSSVCQGFSALRAAPRPNIHHESVAISRLCCLCPSIPPPQDSSSRAREHP